jgi:signal transduction histidine kinase/ActR/RegA family two-component response regulator
MRRYTSLRWKLTWLIAAGSLVTASIAAAGFSWVNLHRFWQHTNSEVAAIAAVVADQVAPAITLEDKRAAVEILRSLSADGLVENAVLYDSRDRCFAWYYRSAGGACAPKPKDGVGLHAGTLVLARPVSMDNDRLGTLVLVARVPSMRTVLGQYVGSAGLILFLSLVVAAIVAMALQARVSTPILAIARVAERIARTHRFNDRVTVASSDELGVLAESFNSMLEEIARRDEVLVEHRRQLEEEVEERNRVNDELRAAKEKAEEAALLKSQFLANMSHEIRTPMNGVVGMIGLVLERCSDPEEREQLTVAQTAAQSLVRLLNEILDLSKIEAGKMTLEAIDFDLPNLVEDALRMFQVSIRQKALRLHFDCLENGPKWVRGDPVRLRQVLINLVGNAVKFTAQGGIRVEVRPAAGGRLRFAVEDTGIGIAPGKREAIFDAFTQADGSHTRRFGGSGLGLTITRRLVDLMGGELCLESEPGRGSCFYFELPMPPVPEPVSTAGKTNPATAVSLPALRVLVAEDNAINQRVIDSMLRRQGWSVTLAGDGRLACEAFACHSFDLILMDIQMPEMDGLEATRWIRQRQRECGCDHPVAVVALTAHASQAQRDQCIEAGMDGVVTKPVTLRALLDCIATVLAPPVAGR